MNKKQVPTLRGFLKEINDLFDRKIPIRTVVSVPANCELFYHLSFIGIYILYSRNKLLYIGYSSEVGRRLLAHFSLASQFKVRIKKVKIIRLYNSDDVFGIEAKLIEHFKPPYNKTNAYLDRYKDYSPEIDLNEVIKQLEHKQ